MKPISCFILSAGFLLLALTIPMSSIAQKGNGEVGTEKPALLVIDIQNAFLNYIPEDDRAFAIKIINHTISTFDQHHLPVIKVHHSDPTWGPVPGTEPFEFPESVIQAENEIHLVKHYHSAFQQTSLDSILQANGCNTLYLCGLSATGCVLATYFGANERNYPAMMIREGIMSPDRGYTKMVNDICESVSFMTMTRMLQQSKSAGSY